jgi:hypothetical protein
MDDGSALAGQLGRTIRGRLRTDRRQEARHADPHRDTGRMNRWLHELPVAWIGVIVLAGVALIVAVVYLGTLRLASGQRGEAMRSLSPGMLPPLGIVFALIVGFLAVGVWGDSDKAKDAVSAEASALRSVVLLTDQLPAPTATRMRLLIRRHIDDAVRREWPEMD